MSGDFCIKCDRELSVYCGPCMDSLRDEYVRVRTALTQAVELAEEGWSYADEHYKAKWDYTNRIAALKKVEKEA